MKQRPSKPTPNPNKKGPFSSRLCSLRVLWHGPIEFGMGNAEMERQSSWGMGLKKMNFEHRTLKGEKLKKQKYDLDERQLEFIAANQK